MWPWKKLTTGQFEVGRSVRVLVTSDEVMPTDVMVNGLSKGYCIAHSILREARVAS